MKCFVITSKKSHATKEIAKAFALACEEIRPEGEVWDVAIHGPIGIGKSTFRSAFAKAVFAKDKDGRKLRGDHCKTNDMFSNHAKKQVRCGDVYFKGTPAGLKGFPLPRKDGFGGYDLLEHAAPTSPAMAHIYIREMDDFSTREITLQVDKAIYNSSAFKSMTEKLNARELGPV